MPQAVSQIAQGTGAQALTGVLQEMVSWSPLGAWILEAVIWIVICFWFVFERVSKLYIAFYPNCMTFEVSDLHSQRNPFSI